MDTHPDRLRVIPPSISNHSMDQSSDRSSAVCGASGRRLKQKSEAEEGRTTWGRISSDRHRIAYSFSTQVVVGCGLIDTPRTTNPHRTTHRRTVEIWRCGAGPRRVCGCVGGCSNRRSGGNGCSSSESKERSHSQAAPEARGGRKANRHRASKAPDCGPGL